MDLRAEISFVSTKQTVESSSFRRSTFLSQSNSQLGGRFDVLFFISVPSFLILLNS